MNAFLKPSGGVLVFSLFAIMGQATASQILPGHIPPAVSHLQPITQLSSSSNLSLVIGLPLHNQEALTNLLEEIYNPSSPRYRHYLTPEEFTREFGPSEADYEVLVAFAEANGLYVTRRHSNRMLIDVSGSVADIERTFHVTIQLYQHPTEHRIFYAPDREPSVDLALPILRISGLDNFSLPRPRLKTRQLSTLRARSLPQFGSGPQGTYMGNDFRAAYVPGITLTGTGQTVGLLEFDGYTASDISNYEATAALPSVTLSNVLIDGFNGQPSGTGGEIEVSLDIEVAISMAPGLSQVLVYEAPNGSTFEDILNRMVTDDAAIQLSCSWYNPNSGPDPVADQIFQEMAAQGQSFLNASGDNDAHTGFISFPGETPYITQVGGTTLTTSSADGPWASEKVWNWATNGIGSGGGISTNYPIPYWQTNVSMANNRGSLTMRNVPDVAFTADNVYVRADGADWNVGGTSCAAPLWAGFIALVNQQAANYSNSALGFLNPTLYQIGTGAAYSSAFHDITNGDNTSSASPNQFFAVPGYDLCTGWGTPAGQPLIDALTLPPPSTPPSIFAQPQDQTVATASNAVFFVTATGSPTLQYQWSFDGTNIDGATNAFLLLPNVQPDQAGDYSVEITNEFGSIMSSNAVLTVEPPIPPVILTQPQDQSVVPGGLAYFSVTVTGTPPSFQWTFNGDAIGGATNNTLALFDVQPGNAGLYAVQVTNAGGGTISSNAALTVLPPEANCESDSNGLVGWWAAEGDARNSLDGTVGQLDGALSFVPGEIGQAFNFNGIDADVKPASSTTFNVGRTNGVTIEAWINPANVTQSQPLVEWQSGVNNGLMLWISIPANFGGNGPGSLTLDLADIGNGELSTPAGLIQPGVWQHVAATFDPASETAAVYLDGTLICQTNFGNFIAVSSPNLWFGYDPASTNAPTHPYGAHYRYAGAMDEVMIYNRALSADEIQAAYNAGTYGQCGLPTTTVTVQPTNEVALTGDTATFTAMANGSLPLSFQWLFNGTDITDATNETLTLTNAQPNQSGNYAVQVSDPGGSVRSSNVVLIVSNATPPFITLQPTNETASVSNSATFRVVSSGTTPLYYQWAFNGANIPQATNASLILSNVLFANAGTYSATVTNMAGLVVSSNAVLTVYPGWSKANATSNAWQCVASSADGTKLVAGISGGTIYRSTDSGTNWQATTAPVADWNCIACSSDGSKLAAGQTGSNAVIYLSTNGGLNWARISAPTGACTSIACSSDGSKLAAAFSNFTTKGIYTSTDSGSTWTQTSAPTTNRWAGLASSADGTKLVAVSTGAINGGSIYVSTNSGETWVRTTNGLNWTTVTSSADGVKLFAIVSGNTGFPGQTSGSIYASTNSGRTWVFLNNLTNHTAGNWQAIACSADAHIVVAANQGSPLAGGEQIYLSMDSGNTWRNAGAPDALWTSLASSADGTKLVAVASGVTLILGNPEPGPIYLWQSAPTLGSILSANGLTLSWPQAWTGYVLQENSDLTTTTWTDVALPPLLTNGQNQVLIAPTNSQDFYRLEFP